MLKQPVNQVRLTNVAVVRLKRRGKRFELACYKNKVLSWRSGIETDLDEVLQTTSIFSNVSKGILAPQDQLESAFRTKDTSAILLEILSKGELQVSHRERAAASSSLFNEIAVHVSDIAVDATTSRPFPVGVIERAMRDGIHYAVVPGRSAKVQAAAVIRQLKESGMDIERARMRVRVHAQMKWAKKVKTDLQPLVRKWESETWSAGLEAVVLIDPGKYGDLTDIVNKAARGQANVEVVTLAVVEDEQEEEEDDAQQDNDQLAVKQSSITPITHNLTPPGN